MTHTANRNSRPAGNHQCNRRSYGIEGGRATSRAHRNDSRNRTVTEPAKVPDWYLIAKASLATELAKTARVPLAEEATVIRDLGERTVESQPVLAQVRYDRTTISEQDRSDRMFCMQLGLFLTSFCLPIWATAVAVTMMVTA